jgi:hypothetical protein
MALGLKVFFTALRETKSKARLFARKAAKKSEGQDSTS